MVEQCQQDSKKTSSKPELVLVRARETGIPKYVPCEAGQYRKWVVFAVITAVTALAVAFYFVMRKKND
ncbi:MAG: hypothetical protein LBB56_04815 [Chitinispirillales bacterium]|jgi:hypothetical protein|nr:hypothetical protein [Chitinispirillales bacterium]